MKLQVRESESKEQQRCPYCQDELTGEATIACDHCTALYHDECAVELKRQCGVLGCVGLMVGDPSAPKPNRKTARKLGPDLKSAARDRMSVADAAREHVAEMRRHRGDEETVIHRGFGWLGGLFFCGALLIVLGLVMYTIWLGNGGGKLMVYAGWALLTCSCAGYAAQNFIQAFALTQTNVHLSESSGLIDPSYVDGLVALDGIPRPIRNLDGKYAKNLIWYRHVVWQYERRSHNEGRWRQTLLDEHCVPFEIDGVIVCNQPTEIYGASSHTIGSWFGEHRVQFQFLRSGHPITVVGKLTTVGGRYTIVPDNIAGMLFTGSRWTTVGAESLKALFFLALSAAAMGGIYFGL